VTDSPQNTARTLQQRGLAVFYACWNSEKTVLYSHLNVLEVVLQSIGWMLKAA